MSILVESRTSNDRLVCRLVSLYSYFRGEPTFSFEKLATLFKVKDSEAFAKWCTEYISTTDVDALLESANAAVDEPLGDEAHSENPNESDSDGSETLAYMIKASSFYSLFTTEWHNFLGPRACASRTS